MKNNNATFWQGISYVAACAAIGYACKVTKSGKPLWAFALIGFPKFIGTVSNSIKVEGNSESKDNVATVEDIKDSLEENANA